MSSNDPRGAGDLVAIIKWYRGAGPAQVTGSPFRDGQSVTVRGGQVVPV